MYVKSFAIQAHKAETDHDTFSFSHEYNFVTTVTFISTNLILKTFLTDLLEHIQKDSALWKSKIKINNADSETAK